MKEYILWIGIIGLNLSISAQETVQGINFHTEHTSYNPSGMHDSHINQWNRLSLALKSENNSFQIEDWSKGSSNIKPIFSANISGYIGIGTTKPLSKLEVKGGNLLIRNLNNTDDSSAIMIAHSINHGEYDTFGTSLRTITQSAGNNVYGMQFFTQSNYTNGQTEKMRIQGNGNIGIGITKPDVKLHIKGKDNSYSQVIVEGGVGAAIQLVSKNNTSLRPVLNGKDGEFSIQIWKNKSSWQSTPFKIKTNGSIAIGTNETGKHKLAVEGSIGAREIKVEATPNWSDFVFEEEYKLPTLLEVEKHIAEKGHLKDIPSAKEVAKKGFFLGEMDAKLLQKIEEITLYTINQDKEIKSLKKENKVLKTINSKLLELQKRLEKLESN